MGELILVMVLALDGGVVTFHMASNETLDDCQLQGEELLLTDPERYNGYICIDRRDSSI